MRLILSEAEKKEFARIQDTFACNAEILSLYARYLNECPRLITPDMIGELTEGGLLTRPEAYAALLAAAFSLEDEKKGRDRRLMREYLAPSVRECDAALYRTDPYFQNIRVPQKQKNGWSLTAQTYAPYEAFVAGPLIHGAEFVEIPPLGYFTAAFSFPSVMQDGQEWMAIKPNEIETMRAPLSAAHGRVLTYGLGLGYFAYMAARRAEVESVTVVERDPAVISLFTEEILPQFGEIGEKITIVCADALGYAAREAPDGCFDYIFADLWHDTGDGVPLYLRLRRLEPVTKRAEYAYWIEDQILSALRAMLFGGLSDSLQIADASPPIYGLVGVRALLSDEGLRALAPTLGSG